MIPIKPLTDLPTHEVINMPPHLEDQDLWMSDSALREGVKREGGSWAQEKLERLGKTFGSIEVFEKAEQANCNLPQMKAFDRYGNRINQVDYHPAYHELMVLAISNEVPNFPGIIPSLEDRWCTPH